MTLNAPAKTLIRVALCCFVAASIGFVWEILAAQAPTSPYHLGVLPGPVGTFRDAAGALGLLFVAMAWLLTVCAANESLRWQRWGIIVGTAITLVALGYAATTGMKGIQIHDPRVDAAWLFRLRALGALVLGATLADLGWRIWRGTNKSVEGTENPTK